MVASRETFPLLAELLAEQQRLDTPVARFAAAHAALPTATVAPLSRQLVPLSAPGPGEQYAFEVDLDSCTGCKSCVAACHSLNGLDDEETWRDVGLLVSPNRRHPFTQTITTACHHCADPACLNGCPVLAYEKDPLTGIVRHLDDQCIGCSYCILKCPYDAPKFSARLGIVRKCDLCHGRLAAGEAPACAQACPTAAIRIVLVDTAMPAPFLAAAPDAAYTRPTTRYLSRRPPPPDAVAADARALRVQPAHWPLALLLTLVPAAVGCAVAALFSRGRVTYYVTLAEVALGVAGLVASGFHLGQPRRAWRIFLGWRTSWLSREAMVLAAWLGLAFATLAWPRLAGATAAAGIAGVFCSAMVYVDTRRRFWRAAQTLPRLFGTIAVVALACVAPPAAALALLAKLTWESRTFFDGSVSARLQRGPLKRAVVVRDLLGLAAVLALVASAPGAGLALFAGGELAERYLFFRAVDAPKMPGMPA